MAKSDKMYSKSPSVKKDKDGKPGISRPKDGEKDPTETGGDKLEGSGNEMPLDIHEKERTQTHKRHEEEQKAMHERHEKDFKEMHKRHEEIPLPAVGDKIEGTK